MKKYTGYIFYFLYWLLFFVAAKALFLLYHYPLSKTLSISEIAKVFLYGLRMDISFTSYICVFPFFLFLVKSVVPNIRINKIIRIYTQFLVILISFLVTADLELYSAWGFRMDTTPLQYFKTPKEMGATISTAPVFVLLLIFILIVVLFVFSYKRFFDPYIEKNQKRFKIADVFFSAFLLVFLFIPIRGGIQKIPMNVSDAYFSEKIFADHAAINLPWNIMFSILNRNDTQNPFEYFSSEKSEKLVDYLYNTGPKRIPSILSVNKPNIIFIILESFTAKWIGCLGGVPHVTPNLDSIAANGLLFTNIYASGDRSEKGQVAVLSGYPNQAITSIIKTPTKTRQLSSINQALEKIGYLSSYTYGGELEFANIKSYLINIKMDQLIDKYSFPVSERTTSWGVHDQYVFNRFYNDIQKEKQPFFATMFTLSSHEPYDVPMKPVFKGKDETTLFKNSVYYTDSVIGNFMAKLKKDSLWKNTLVVFVADHGHPLPGHDPNDRPSKFHIPLIFSGGALKLKGVINNIGSQTDIVTTLLDQLNLPANNFKWGKDLLDSSARQFAFYSFNNGFGFVTPKGTETIDNVSKKTIYKDSAYDTSDIKYGKAYMQFSYQDFLNR
ncbi:MAG: sulfatase-like hydrolase/transferase [Bacteroidota bacterium]|nr:sulfatase-like hydrolase/transferase [Bacteroidota bacterium]